MRGEAIVEGVGSICSVIVWGKMGFAREEEVVAFGFGGPGEGAEGGFEVGAEVEEEDGVCR